MKKLLAIFAILAAFSSTAFAASDDATATVNVWNPISVQVDVTTAPDADILIGETTTAVFTATGTWDTDATGFDAEWTWTSTGAGWDTPVENGTELSVDLTGTNKGICTFTATYTVTYGF